MLISGIVPLLFRAERGFYLLDKRTFPGILWLAVTGCIAPLLV
jgi:hypothetical protein